MPPVISVIIPVYNVEKYLNICLESILIQSVYFEILLINDGSTDNSGNICEQYAKQDKRIKVFHTINSGPGKARNLGLQKVTGKYIIFIDADDYIEQDTFNIVLNKAEENRADLVVYPFFDKKGSVIEKRKISECNFEDQKTKAMFLKKVWLHDEMLATTWNKLYKADIIRKNKILFNEEFFIAEDYLFNLAYIDAAEKGVSINTPLYYYIRHENSVSSKVFFNKYDIALSVYKESMKLINKYNIEEIDYLNKIRKEYATAIIRAMFETTRQGYNRSLFTKLNELKKCMSGKETRSLFSSSFDLSVFNGFVVFCLKYKQSIMYYLAFKIRNTIKGI